MEERATNMILVLLDEDGGDTLDRWLVLLLRVYFYYGSNGGSRKKWRMFLGRESYN